MALRSLFCSAVVMALASAAQADSITINGRTYHDVLVYASRSMYYVSIPTQGKVISTPKDGVDATTVTINDDPYYRDTLKQKFEQTKDDLEAGRPIADGPLDPAFDVAVQFKDGSGSTGTKGGRRAGGGGKPLGFPKALIVGAMGAQGVKFNGNTGRSADGVMTVQLQGPDANLTGIVVTLAAPQAEMAKIFGGMQKMMGLINQRAPWAQAWVGQNQAALMQGKPIQKTQGGVFLKIAAGQSGQNISLTITMKGA